MSYYSLPKLINLCYLVYVTPFLKWVPGDKRAGMHEAFALGQDLALLYGITIEFYIV